MNWLTRLIDILGHNWAIVVIALTVTSLVLVAALVIRYYVRISLNIMRSTKPPLSRNPLDFERLTGEAVAFPAYDGLRLNGMLIRAQPGSSPLGLIIFAHEYCADMHSCARYCRPLLEVGYDILTFDFRGHGQSPCNPGYSPRQWVTDFEIDDMRGAVAFAREWLIQHGRAPQVGVFGISRGACAAIIVASRDSTIRALVADGAFSTDAIIEHFMRRWADIFATVRIVPEDQYPSFWRFLRWTMVHCAARELRCRFPSVLKVIRRMKPVPIFFIHGERDSYIPVEQSRLLYTLAGQPKEFWVAQGARHNQAALLHPETYARLTVGFFARRLTGIRGPLLPVAPASDSRRGGAASRMPLQHGPLN